jgi:hypothetical protein
MVVDPDLERVRVKSDQGIAQRSTLECQELWSPLDGAKKMAEFAFDATTNLECGK